MKLLVTFLLMGVAAFGADPIRIKGSDTLGAKLMPQLCEIYRTQHPDARFEIAAEGTFGPLLDFLAGKVDILMAIPALDPKRMEPFEKAGIVLKRVATVTDVFVIAVNASNPVGDLSLAQVEALFTGDHANWKAVGGNDAPVSLYTRNSASGSYRQFQLAAMEGRPYAKSSVRFAGGEHPGLSVEKDPNGISYLGLLYARAKGLKVVKIDGIDPLGKDVWRYPLLRPAYYYYREDARPEVVRFISWMTTSPEAAEMARRIGFLSHP